MNVKKAFLRLDFREIFSWLLPLLFCAIKWIRFSKSETDKFTISIHLFLWEAFVAYWIKAFESGRLLLHSSYLYSPPSFFWSAFCDAFWNKSNWTPPYFYAFLLIWHGMLFFFACLFTLLGGKFASLVVEINRMVAQSQPTRKYVKLYKVIIFLLFSFISHEVFDSHKFFKEYSSIPDHRWKVDCSLWFHVLEPFLLTFGNLWKGENWFFDSYPSCKVDSRSVTFFLPNISPFTA